MLRNNHTYEELVFEVSESRTFGTSVSLRRTI